MPRKNEVILNNSLGLLAKSSLVVFVSLILSKILTYIYKIVIARTFNTEIYGLFNFALIIISVVATFASLGMPDGLLRFISLDRKNKSLNKSKYLFSIATKVVLTTSILLGGILYFLSDFISIGIFHKPDLIIYLKIFSIALPFITFGSIFLVIIRAFERIHLYTFIQNILQNAIKLIVLAILIFAGFRLSAIFSSYLIAIIIFFVVAYFGAKKYLKKIRESNNIDEKQKNDLRKKFISYSWPIIFLGIASNLLYWIDSFVIGYYMDASSLGFYNVTFTLIGFLGIAPEIFMQLFLPMVIKEYSKNRIDVIRELSKQVSKWILIINIPVFTIIILYPGAIINILFGKEYLIAANSLRILALGGFFASITLGVLTNLLSMKGKSKTLLIDTLLMGLLNLVLNILFVPKYGINGAAFATTLSLILFGIILLAQTKYYLDIFPLRRKMLNIILVSFIPLIILIFVKEDLTQNLFSFIIVTIVYLIIYILFVLLSGGLDEKDWLICDLIKKKFVSQK